MSRPIFLTVGSQMPFERLVDAFDAWLGAHAPEVRSEAFAQVGRASTPPHNVPSAVTLTADEYERRVREAALIVAHAGTGTIFTALRHGVPLLVLARRADLRETRNDHQDATARRFEERGLLTYARDEAELARHLDAWRAGEGPLAAAPRRLAGRAEGPLVERLASFLTETLGAPAGDGAGEKGEVGAR